ncbi:MAG: element excision factor XisH family protein [Caldilineaceae bacterium]
MSRRDNYHDIVKEALIREGWTITHDPYRFLSSPELTTDLGAEKPIAAERGNDKIAVEIKSFLSASRIADLEKAIGQYVLYATLLQRQEPERTLYLAIPKYAFNTVFATQVGKIAIESFALRLIVFSIEEEEELLWKAN